MKYIKKYKQLNEELSKNSIMGGAIALGALGAVGAGLHDKMIEPNQINISTHVEIPNHFELKKKILSIGTDMYITNEEKDNFGKIEERVISFGKTFQYKDNTGKVLATAREEVFTLFTEIKIYDENDILLGSVGKRPFSSISPLYSLYSIKDESGNIIGESEKTKIMVADVDIKDNSNQDVISIREKIITIAPVYMVDINEKCNIDKRLIIFIPSFIVSKESESENNN